MLSGLLTILLTYCLLYTAYYFLMIALLVVGVHLLSEIKMVVFLFT